MHLVARKVVIFAALNFSLIADNALGGTDKVDDIALDSIIAGFGSYVKQLRIHEWKIAYAKTDVQDGEVYLKYRASIPNSDPNDLARILSVKKTLKSYCAGIFGETKEAFHIVESETIDGNEEIQRNGKVVFDGQNTKLLSFPPIDTFENALAEKRSPRTSRTTEGQTWSRILGEGSPLDVMAFYLGFGLDQKLSLEERCAAFFTKSSSVSIQLNPGNIISVTRVSLPPEVTSIYRFDRGRNWIITSRESQSALGLRSRTDFEYTQISINTEKVFIPKRITTKVELLDGKGASSVMTSKECIFSVFSPATEIDRKKIFDTAVESWSWKTIITQEFQ